MTPVYRLRRIYRGRGSDGRAAVVAAAASADSAVPTAVADNSSAPRGHDHDGCASRRPLYLRTAAPALRARDPGGRGAAESVWQVGSLEPGLDLGDGAPGIWTPGTPDDHERPVGALAATVRLQHYRPSARRAAASTSPPLEPTGTYGGTNSPCHGAAAGIRDSHLRSSCRQSSRRGQPAGRVRSGRWTATFVAPPPEGIAWGRPSPARRPSASAAMRVAVTSARVPGGEAGSACRRGCRRSGWSGARGHLGRPSAPPPLEPVPPLR